MSKKKICYIAQFPPPMHGLSKAVETLYNSELQNEFEFEKIDITNNMKFIKNLIMISRSQADLFYFTISQTKCGNLRDLIILKLLDLQGKKCLIHLHGGYYRKLVDNDLSSWQRKANFRAVKKLAGAIVLGPSLKPIFRGMIDEEKIFTVPNCVDDEYLLSDDDYAEKIRTLPDRKVKHVLYLSNFIKSKGYPDVLKIVKLEKSRVDRGKEKQFHFDFAGKFFEKSEEDFFWHYIKENKLEDYITYHGVVNGDEKRNLLKKCDVFVLLTRYPKEGQPISILEAMGNGMVVVTTDHAGIPDLIKDGRNGLMFATKCNALMIYKKLLSLKLSNFKTITNNNRNDAVKMFCQDQYIKNMRIIYFKLCS